MMPRGAALNVSENGRAAMWGTSQVSPHTAEGHGCSRLPMQMRLTEDGTPYRPPALPRQTGWASPVPLSAPKTPIR